MSTAAFIAECQNPFGEPLTARLDVLDLNASSDWVTRVSDNFPILSVSKIVREREKKHGIMQGQAWQIVLAWDQYHSVGDYSNSIAKLEVGFEESDEWEAVAQGRINRVVYSTDGTITFEVYDTIVDLLGCRIPRDIQYQAAGWVSEMQVVSKDPDSKGWSAGSAIAINSESDLEDETFTLAFTTATAFSITRDGGSGSQTGNISSSMNVSNSNASNVLTIPSSGWDTSTGAYSPGDTFVFYTAAARTSTQLTPVQMIMDLISEFVPFVTLVTEPPVDASVFSGYSTWTAAVSDTSGTAIGGFWAKGTEVSRLIQDCLKIVHASIYATASGQLALWYLKPNTGDWIGLNGDPATGSVSIVGATMTDDSKDRISSVIYDYLDMDGDDAYVEAVDDSTTLQVERQDTVSIGWRVRGLSVESAANIHLNRFKHPRRVYELQTTLAGILADVGGGVSITDPELGLTVEASDVSQVEIDVFNNTCKITAYLDPVVVAEYAVVGTSTVGGSEVVW